LIAHSRNSEEFSFTPQGYYKFVELYLSLRNCHSMPSEAYVNNLSLQKINLFLVNFVMARAGLRLLHSWFFQLQVRAVWFLVDECRSDQ